MNTIFKPLIGTLLILLSTGCFEAIEEQDLTRISQALEGEFEITVPPLEIGEIADINASGAEADERVVLVRGTEIGDGGCPASLGGECLGVSGSIAMIGRSRANADGVAEFHWPVSPGTPLGMQFCMQAFVKRGPGGADSILSNVICENACSGAGCDDCLSDMDGDSICDDVDPCPEDTDNDSDGDGYTDAQEIQAGTDPKDGYSLIYQGYWPYNLNKNMIVDPGFGECPRANGCECSSSSSCPENSECTQLNRGKYCIPKVGSRVPRFVGVDQFGDQFDL